jgi:hypothetical protein
MKTWILDAGCWMLDHGVLVLWSMASLCAAVMITRLRRRRRSVKRPVITLDLTAVNRGWKRLSPLVVMTEQDRLDHIADVSFAAGLAIGGVGMAALIFIALVWCLRGSGNRPRNGRGVS